MQFAMEEPMFVNSSYAVPDSLDGHPWEMDPISFFDAMSWHQNMSHAYENEESLVGLSGVMHQSKLATSPSLMTDTYLEGHYAQTERHDSGSDVSTADTSPYLVEEGFNAATMSGEAWQAAGPAVVPSRQSWQPSHQTGWGDLPSAGSARHHTGQCKPCAFAWKPEGCESGADCIFCHLCPAGEKQRRKRVLRHLQRNMGQC